MQQMTPEQQRALAIARARRRRAEAEGQGSAQPSAPARPQLPEWPEDVADRQAREANPQQPQRERTGVIPAFSRGNANVFYLGAADELAGFVENVGQRVGNIFRAPDDRVDPNEAGRNATQEVRRLEREAREDRPVAYGTGQVSGGVIQATTTGVGGRAVAPAVASRYGAAVASRPLATTAATGAVEGGIYGFNEAEGGIGNRAMGALGGSVLGAIAGPLTMAAIGLGRQGVNAVRNRFPGGAQAIDQGVDEARRGAVRFAERFGLGREIRNNPAALADNGGDFLAERSGPRGAYAARFVAGRGDETAEIAQEAIDARAAGRGGRIAEATGRATGVDDPRLAVMGIGQLEEQARPLFNAADQEMVNVEAIRPILRRLRARGLDFDVADQLAIDAGVPGVRLSAYVDDMDGLPPQIPLGSVRALARAAEATADNSFNAQGARPALGPAFQNDARELRDFMRNTSQTYSQAASLWSGARRGERAYEYGTRVFENRGELRAEEVRRFANSGHLSVADRRMFLAGVADAIQRQVNTTRSSGNAAARLDKNIIRFRLREFLGEDAADEILSRVDLENARVGFENNINRRAGSQTNPNNEAMRQGYAAESGRFRAFMAELVENPLEAVRGRGARRNMADLIRNGNDEDIAEVARLLFSTGDVSDDPLVRALMREAERRGVLPGGASLALVAPAQDALTSRDQ